MKKLITKSVNLIKSLFCEHDLKSPVITYSTPDYVPGEVIHPLDKTKIHVLKREFTITSECRKCGKKIASKGYNTIPLPEGNTTEAEKSDVIRYRIRRAEQVNKKPTRFKSRFGREI